MKYKDVLGFVIGPLGAAALGILVIPATTWIFSAEDVGRLNVSLLVINLGLLLCSLGLDQSYVREFHRSSKKPALLLLCIFPGFCFVILLGAATMPFARPLSVWLYGLQDPRLYYLLYGCILVGFISRFLSLVLRMQERGFSYAATQVFPKAFLLLLLALLWGATSTRDFLYLQGATFLSSAFVLLLMVFFTRSEWMSVSRQKILKAELKAALSFGVPLVFSALAFWGVTAAGTISLRTFSMLSEVAIYSVAMSLAGVAAIFQAIFSVMWAPILYKWVEGSGDLSRVDVVARRTLAVAFFLFLFCGSISGLVDFILPRQYVSVKYLLLCTILQPILYTLSEVTCVGIGITRRTMLSLWIALTAMFVNLVCCVLLVPTLGAAGAAIANTLAFFVFFVARTEVSSRIWMKFPRKKIYLTIGFLVTLAILEAGVGARVNSGWSLIFVFLLPVPFFAFKSEWVDLCRLGRQSFSRAISRKITASD